MANEIRGCADDATTRFGELLLRIGAMSKEQLERVREQHAKQPERSFREIAVELGFVSDRALESTPESEQHGVE